MFFERPMQLLLIVVVEAVLGYPDAIYRRVRHPVVWLGSLISSLDARFNTGTQRSRRIAGCAVLVVLVGVAGGAGWGIEWLAAAASASPGASTAATGIVGIAALLIATTGFAQRSLHDHVLAVFQPLQSGDLPAARIAVARIVGRDTKSLDEQGVSTAAIESLAESFCDGIVAPAFWFLVAGLPGLFICKAVNTADSMIGHKNERHLAFGWAAARADDLLNLLPARIAAVLICVAGGGGMRVAIRDASKHESPNAGWPEAAMAGVLARQLGGPVSYDGESTWRATFGDGPAPKSASLRVALNTYLRACFALWVLLAGAACGL